MSDKLRYFEFSHLPPKLQRVSQPVHKLAKAMDKLLPEGAEKTAGMRKLLEAKDCYVRAALDLVIPQEYDFAPHVQRMMDEYEELDARVTALETFINENGIFKGLPDQDQKNMHEQLSGMFTYRSALLARLRRAENS